MDPYVRSAFTNLSELHHSCTTDNLCETGVCDAATKKCIVYEEGMSCKAHINCNKNMRCLNRVCVKSIAAGNECNVLADACRFGSMCVSVDNEGYKCTPYFSVLPNSAVEGKQQEIYKVCHSYTFNYTSKVCTETEKTLLGWPFVCN